MCCSTGRSPLHSATPLALPRPTCALLECSGPAGGINTKYATLGRNGAPGPLLLSGCTICCGHCGTRASSAASASLWAPLRLFSRLVAFSGLLVAAAPPRMEAMGAAGSGVADFALCCKARGPLFAWISQWHCNSNRTRPNASADGKRGASGLLMGPTYQHHCLACGLGRPASAALEFAFFSIRKPLGALHISNSKHSHNTNPSTWICLCSISTGACA